MLLFLAIVTLVVGNLPQSEATACSYSCPERYYTSCGFLGWSRCSRYRDRTCYRCCTGWTGSTSNNCPTPVCFGSVNCPNGGTCTSPNYCSNCNQGFYSPRCNRCTAIANCLDVFCSTSSNQKCDRCDGDYGSDLGSAYNRSDDMRRCIEQCSWRSDSNACYPGSCTNANCTCSSGFSGTDCRTMGSSQAPTLSEHRATLILGTTTLESPTDQGNTGTVYTNVHNFTSIKIKWTSSYQPTGLPDPSSGGHPYVYSYGIGVIGAGVEAVVNRGLSAIYAVGSRNCTNGSSINSDSPTTHLVSCEYTFSLNYSEWRPATGDVMRYDVSSTSGGYLKLFDRDHSSSIITRYYSGRITSAHATFTFDFDGPYHCVNADNGCRTTMLDAGNDVTSEEVVNVSWQDWADDLAGIREYQLQVLQLSISDGNEMTEIFDNDPVYSGVGLTGSGMNVTLPRPGVYSFLLTVVDNVGNTRLTRRFAIFDNDPDDVTVQNDTVVRVFSRTGEAENLWLTNLNSTGGQTSVQIDWTNRFLNKNYLSQGWLKPIGFYAAGAIDDDYDQNFGQRGRAAIPHKLGVTEFRVFYDIDHKGGRTTTDVGDDNSDNWSNETTNTRATYNLTLVDGDSVRFWLEARDLVGHFARDSVLVHADSSPPIIQDLSALPSLRGISVECRIYDIHSGIKAFEWRLSDNHTGTEMEQRSQIVPGMKINVDRDGCDPASCTCIPIGDCYAVVYRHTFHVDKRDLNYFITVAVTNQAGLVSTKTIKTNGTVTQDNVGEAAKFLATVTNDTSSVDDSSVASAADILDDIVNIQDTSPKVTASVINVVNNLLQVDAKKLNDSSAVANSSSRIVKALEKQISNVLAGGENISQVTTSVAVVAMNFDNGSLANGVGFAAVSDGVTDSLLDEDIGVYRGSDGDIPLEGTEASVKLPAAILKNTLPGRAIPISFVMYGSSSLFRSELIVSSQSSDEPRAVGGRVIFASVLDAVITDLPPENPVVTAFNSPLNEAMDQTEDSDQVETCVFWDFSLRDGIGDWSTDGCRKDHVVNGRIVCLCDHATNFAVLVNIHGQKNASFALDVISKLGCGISIAALLITILIYLAIRPLRSKTPGRILISLCLSLLCLYLVFLAGIEQTSSRSGCIAAAVLMHYFTLTSMAWMGVEAANLYLKVVKVFGSDVSHFMVKASIVAWGFPAVVTSVILAADHEQYENKYSCFLKPGPAFYYGQLLLIGIISLFNVVIFVLVVRQLTCSVNEVKNITGDGKRKKIMKRLQNVASISILLGLTWVFGLLSLFEASNFAFQVIFSIVNSLQGLLIFLLFVVRQDKVRKYVRNLAQGKKSTHLTGSFLTSKSTLSPKKDPPTKSVSEVVNQTAASVYNNPVFKENKDLAEGFDTGLQEVTNKGFAAFSETGTYEDMRKDSTDVLENDVYEDLNKGLAVALENGTYEDMSEESRDPLENDVYEDLNKGLADAFENGTYEDVSKDSSDPLENDEYEDINKGLADAFENGTYENVSKESSDVLENEVYEDLNKGLSVAFQNGT
ncbi:uncharacterized protein LOC110986009 [Acanthaster planci]|uniref:Uncharacterized protein LOC110986009 n=1 Tax=Acanthaster planci TaxID=133434 RepID=A0A8B7ZC62_ACAPL|nr:uncharacterized protein LOC110986009 [Acanthaster planci]